MGGVGRKSRSHRETVVGQIVLAGDQKERPLSQYLLSTYRVGGEVPGAPHTPEEMQAFMARVIAPKPIWTPPTRSFGGALKDPDAAKVVSPSDSEAVDGPFAEAKEHIAGFYIINADDDDAALAWAEKVAEATQHPIEVRPFFATGRVADHEMPDA